MLKITGLTKQFAQKRVVDDVTIHVESGDIFGFIGHNGAGKTTTIKCITGILSSWEGEILIDGKSVREYPMECKRKIAYIPDNPDVYEHLKGIQYLNFIADIFGMKERQKQIEKYAELFEIKDRLNDPIASYSHGMKQKIAIISALMHDPLVMIMDEPFVGLDPKAAFIVKEVIRDFCNQGRAVFFSTHVLEVAEKLCNKVAIIKQGKILCSGNTDEVRGDSSLETLFLELTDSKE